MPSETGGRGTLEKGQALCSHDNVELEQIYRVAQLRKSAVLCQCCGRTTKDQGKARAGTELVSLQK